jgi:hypothetical protein
MTISIATTTRDNALAQITSAVGASGRFRIYDGTPPASANAALSGNNLLADLPCSATFAPAPASGVLTANGITTTNAALTGTASFFRVTTSGGTSVFQGTVATSGGDCNLNTLSIVSGGPVAISSLVLTAGNP